MFNKNPTIIINGLSELARQVLPLLVVVGIVKIGPEKLAGLISLIGLVLAFISTTLIKSQVTPNETATQQITVALRKEPTTTSVEDVKNIVKEQNV